MTSDSARERALSSAVSHHGIGCKCTAEADVPAVLARCHTAACQAECRDICLSSTAILHASEPASRLTYRGVLQVDFAADELPVGRSGWGCEVCRAD